MSDRGTEERLALVENAVVEIKSAMNRVAGAIETVVRLEERHIETRNLIGRILETQEKHDARIDVIERDMPQLREARKALKTAIGVVLTAVLTAVVGLVVKAKDIADLISGG
jgi:hypothetical protein